MQIGKNKVVTLDYTLTNPAGEQLDTSQGGEPLAYLHGIGQIIPGLERALDGHADGDALTIVIPPDEAYGARRDALVQAVPRKSFGNVPDIAPGMQFQANTQHGPRIVTVTKVDGDEVTVDANHPLAGITLHFDVKIVGVRDATPEELAHGHVHGPGGHHHH